MSSVQVGPGQHTLVTAQDAVVVAALHQRYGKVDALDDVGFSLRANAVHGLLGRNGAGKTTLLRILAGHLQPTSGRVQVFGRTPYEDAEALGQFCFIRESQRYPDGFRVWHVLRAARLFFPHWDGGYADRLLALFELPSARPMSKLSRGMLSAVGLVVGLASRAPLTIFDEPYDGLDAVARQRFFDVLLTDVAERPRTVVLSTHLIDEVADLLEYVVILDHGRVIEATDADSLRQAAVTVSGASPEVDAAVAGLTVISRDRLGGTSRATARIGELDLERISRFAVSIEPVSLQRLVVQLTTSGPIGPASGGLRAAPDPSEGSVS